ncbi:TPA: hypothetical protein DE059_04890 [Candidatus Peribacteria bacterium]|nr:hypothetical protein [Candidatus Peribacteria bacterium]|tara:strand:+ start:436 stop:897 length:462 start_codon:yes stop_codon:yes gene_type:complete
MPPKEKKETGQSESSVEKTPVHVRTFLRLENNLDQAVKNAQADGKDSEAIENDSEVVRCNEAIENFFYTLAPEQVSDIHKHFNQQRTRERIKQEQGAFENGIRNVLDYGVVRPVRAAVGPIANLTEETTRLITRTFVGFFRGIGRGWSGRNAA